MVTYLNQITVLLLCTFPIAPVSILWASLSFQPMDYDIFQGLSVYRTSLILFVFLISGESTTKGYIEFFDHVSANVAYTIINSYPSFRRFGTTAAWYLSNRSQVSGDNRVVARVVPPPPGLEVQRCVVAGHGGAGGSFFQRALVRAPVAQKQTFKQAYERGPKPEIKLPVPGEPSAFAIRMAARRAKVDPASTAAIDPKADSTGARLLADEQRLQAEKGSLS